MLRDRLVLWSKSSATLLERVLALVIIGGVLVFAVGSGLALVQMDWREVEAIYEFIYRVLLMVIGVELARTLLTHDLDAILELLAFVVARKMLKPDTSVVDIILSVLAFGGLLAARKYLVAPRVH